MTTDNLWNEYERAQRALDNELKEADQACNTLSVLHDKLYSKYDEARLVKEELASAFRQRKGSAVVKALHHKLHQLKVEIKALDAQCWEANGCAHKYPSDIGWLV